MQDREFTYIGEGVQPGDRVVTTGALLHGDVPRHVTTRGLKNLSRAAVRRLIELTLAFAHDWDANNLGNAIRGARGTTACCRAGIARIWRRCRGETVPDMYVARECSGSGKIR